MTVGDKLKQLRIERKLTRKELSALIDMPVESIVNYEDNRSLPGLKAMAKFEEFYDIKAVELMRRDNSTSKNDSDADYQSFSQKREKALLGDVPLIEESLGYNYKNNIVGNRLKQLRKEKKLTQQELADILKISKVSIVSYEGGNKKPGLDIVYKYEKFFHITTAYLFGEEEYLDSQIDSECLKKEIVDTFIEMIPEIVQDVVNKVMSAQSSGPKIQAILVPDMTKKSFMERLKGVFYSQNE